MDDHVFPGDLVGGFTAQDPDQPPSPPHSGQSPVAPWQQDEPRPTRRLALLLAAAVPWLVLLAVLLRPTATPTAGLAVEARPTDPLPSPTVEPATTATMAEPVVPVVRTHGDTPSAVELAGAVAVVVARAHLGTVGPAPALPGIEPGPPGRYVEHLVVERVDMPSTGAAVVTVLAVLLTASDDRYDGVEVARLAVPVVFDGDRAAPAGQPWALPAPDLAIAGLDVVPDERPDLTDAVHAALTAAGFTQVDDLRVAIGDGWPVVAEFTGTGPGQTGLTTHVLWLRRHLDGLVVAGTSAAQESRP
jgi:hypothetical protein